MEAILPFKIKNEQTFFDCALKIGYDEMEIYKFVYVMQQSDLDTFPKMHDERINVLIYGWELCEDYKQQLNADEWELPEELETILKLLMPWSMDIWFSKEWDKCKSYLKTGLIHCLNRARDLLMRMPDMMQINWDFLLLYNLTPWNVPYLKNLTVTRDKTLETGAQSIETEELPATNDDISYVKLEQLPLIVLRLVKLFDQSSIDMVKTLCMRVIAAWNNIYQIELKSSGRRMPYVPPEDKRCLMLICHIYLMAVYEADDVRGYIIDNMINNIRFYYQGFQNSTAHFNMDNLDYTPARFIALTNIHLRVQKRDFFDFFIWNKYDTSAVNLFGVVSQAYKSYLLGNLLMELNNMNEDDFAANIPLYKRLMNSYVNEREKSELFLLNELEKLELQHYAHNILPNIKSITDFKSKICKGNRMSNIGNYENSDDTVAPIAEAKPVEVEKEVNVIMEAELKDDTKELDDFEEEEKSIQVKENELRLDPIFQNMPNNESILYYVYEVLAKKDYKGWHFAKIVLLMKIIDHELNMIETWRYHPGLTTDFMLNLEEKLSHHYVDLAKIFKQHAFIEQEFWLTAFYLNPTSENYEIIKRFGMRNNRKRTEEPSKMAMSTDNIEAKFGLLSSTIEVKEIANLANTDDTDANYNILFSALHSLRLPDSLVKDMITAIFLPRNKSFAWAIDWNLLRSRCKMIMNSMNEKRRFVELNMAEANDRLKYLIIDYEKYKNRPQLDYGTIEQGYENLMNSGDFDKETDDDEEEEEEEEDFEDDEDVYENKNRGRGRPRGSTKKKEVEKIEDDNSQEDDPFLKGKRRTRARTAATLASILFQTLPRSSRRKRNVNDDEAKVSEDKTKSNENENNEKLTDSKSPVTASEPAALSPLNAGCDTKDCEIDNLPTKNIKEFLKERPAFANSTQGFQHLIDIWNVEKTELQTIDENCVSLLESSNILQRAVKWKSLSRAINPLGGNEQEYIDDAEMVIENIEMPIKKEYDFNMVTAFMEEVKLVPENIAKQTEIVATTEMVKSEMNSDSNVAEHDSNKVEPVTAMEVDEEEEKEKGIKEQNIAELKPVMVMNEKDEVSEDKITTEQLPIKSERPERPEVHVENVPEENEKEQTLEEIPPIEDYSESIISDLSTEAIKDSGEISESNTETNSKRNSFNYDMDYEDKIELSQDLNESEDTINDKKIIETEHEYIKEEKTTELAQECNRDEQETKDTEENCTGIIESTVVEYKTENESITKKTDTIKQLDAVENVEKLNENDELSEKDKDLQEKSEVDISLEKIEVKNSNNDSLQKESNILTEKYTDEETTAKNLEQQLCQLKEDINNISTAIELNSEPQKYLEDNIKSSQDSENKVDLDELPSESKDSDKQALDVENSQQKSTDITTANKEDSSVINKEFIEEDLTSANESKLFLYYSTTEEDNSLIDKINEDSKQFENPAHTPPIIGLDESTADSLKSSANSTDSETRYLKSDCLTKQVKILVRKLGADDLKDLRQPKIRIKRVNLECYTEEFRAKRRCVSSKVYLNLDDDSSSNSYGANTSSSDTYRPTKQKRKIPIRRQSVRNMRTSDSDNDSVNSDDIRLSKMLPSRTIHERRFSTPSTSQSSTKMRSTKPRTSGPKSARHKTAGPKSSKTSNLVVTPRSASGLKLRISQAEQTSSKRAGGSKPKSIAYDEIIQLSSSSGDDVCNINDLTVIEEEIIEIDEDNPLFEEEIII